MRRLVVAGLLVAGFLLSADFVQACGGRRGGCGSASACGGCCEVWGGGCAMTACQPCCAPPACEERVVTCQRPVCKTRMVQREVCEMVAKCVQEPVSYTVMEPVFTPCTKRI